MDGVGFIALSLMVAYAGANLAVFLAEQETKDDK